MLNAISTGVWLKLQNHHLYYGYICGKAAKTLGNFLKKKKI